METLVIIILLASISNFLLGLFVFIKDPRKRLNRLFGIFGVISATWCFTNFMVLFNPPLYPPFFWKGAYAFGSLTVVSAVLWAMDISGRKITKFKAILFSSLGIFFFFISYLTNLIVVKITKIYPQRVEHEAGTLFFLYSLYLFAMLSYMVYSLISGYKMAYGIKKIQLSYVLIGSSSYIAVVLVGTALLPIFGNFDFIMLDSPSSLILVLFTTLAIAKYHLFEIKVILTEFLVGVLATILLILPFLMPTGALKTLTIFIFLLFSIFGYLLIGYAHREAKQKEILEDKVKERTKELQTTHEEMKKEKERLERLYKATVGRELRMIELKKEIKQKDKKIEELGEKSKGK